MSKSSRSRVDHKMIGSSNMSTGTYCGSAKLCPTDQSMKLSLRICLSVSCPNFMYHHVKMDPLVCGAEAGKNEDFVMTSVAGDCQELWRGPLKFSRLIWANCLDMLLSIRFW